MATEPLSAGDIADALRESQRTLAALMRNLPGMAYRCRADAWTMEFVSGGARALTGYGPAELVGNRTQAFVDLIHPDDLPRVREAVNVAVGRGEPFQVEYRITRADAQE